MGRGREKQGEDGHVNQREETMNKVSKMKVGNTGRRWGGQGGEGRVKRLR